MKSVMKVKEQSYSKYVFVDFKFLLNV